MSSRRGSRKPKYLGLLRGLQNPTAAVQAEYRTLQNLKKETPLSEASAVEETLRGSPLYSHLGLPKLFPMSPPSIPRYQILEARELDFELQTASWRINSEKKRLLSAFDELDQINRAFEKTDIASATNLLVDFRSNYGDSFVLFAKASLAHHLSERNSEKSPLGTIIDEYGIPRRNIIALSVYDTLGQEYEYRSLRSNTISFFASGRYEVPRDSDALYGYDTVRHTMYPYCWSRIDFSRILNTLSYASLLDVTIFLMSHLDDQILNKIVDAPDGAFECIDRELRSSWTKLSSRRLPRFATGDEPRFADSYAYRRGLAFRELTEFRRFRLAVDPFIRDPNDSYLIVPPRLRGFARLYFGLNLTIGDLTQRAEREPRSLDQFDAQNSNVMSRTAALVRLLRSDDELHSLSEEQLLTLLDCTLNVATVCTPAELRRLAGLNNQSDLYKYIVCALIYDQTGRNIDRVRLANALQDVVIARCSGDLENFANLLYRSGTHIARHFYELCTDEFLGLLFRMYRTSSEVSEARATIQEWFGDKFNEPIAFERAKAIRLNRRLQLRRGQINDTRIFVDTLRFNQWIEENLYSSLAAGLSAVGDQSLAINGQLNLDNFAERRTATGQLASVLESAFNEFCKNANYGIDSYLGRRIRHGTLIGTMAGPIRKMLQGREAKSALQIEHTHNAVHQWLDQYERHLKRLATEELQVHSDQKQKGLIRATVLDIEKLPSIETALKRLVVFHNDHQTVPATSVVLVELCWQLLEVDLRRIRQRLQEHRTSWGRLSGNAIPADCSAHERQKASDFIRALNQTADQQFAVLTSWFAKPASTAASANLSELLDVTIAEAQEHQPGFDPKKSIRGDSNIEILGITYHHLYDALSVLMENAAQHGKVDGELIVDLALSTISDTHQKIDVSVSSELASNTTQDAVRACVTSALTYDNRRAMVQEGRSGLRKLKQMESDLREIENIKISIENNRFKVSFSFNLFLSVKS